MTIVEDIWAEILKESKNKISLEPDSESLFQEKILSCNGLDNSLSAKLADDLATKEYSSEILKEKLKHFVSKEALNIDGFGKKIVENFWNLNLIKFPHDIFKLDYTKIENLEGWGNLSVSNLKYAIENSKKI